MERGGLSRIILFVGLAVLLFFGWNKLSGQGGSSNLQPIHHAEVVGPHNPEPPQSCDLWTEGYRARVSTRGAVLTSFEVLTAKYRVGDDDAPRQLVTTPDYPVYSPLYTAFKESAAKPGTPWLLDGDVHDWKIVESTATRCALELAQGDAVVRKVISVDPQSPYELRVAVTVKNAGKEARSVALAVSTAEFLRASDVKGKMFTTNPRAAHVECITADAKATRKTPDDFEASDFEDAELFPHNDLNRGDWLQPAAPGGLAGVSSAYFTNAVDHVQAPSAPVCQLQVEQRWNSAQFKSQGDDPNAGGLYKARLVYPVRTLAPGASDTYELTSFIGPKERAALQEAGPRFGELIDLGFFSFIAKLLVQFLLKVHSVVHNWGLAIVVLTVTARTLLFPLTVPSIKNMIHMRELKPEIDALNEKYKDDAQAKGLAQMELWKKHGVNPMKGCLPQLVSMPVWFALYTTLQTAVELYNIPFLWFPDLSSPDPYFVLPFIIGGVFFLQQVMMPVQAGDAAQQKMMRYFMPGMFTVFMLFLPAGLGVYMFTNSLLGIVQQQLVERHVRKSLVTKKSETAQVSSPKAKKKPGRG